MTKEEIELAKRAKARYMAAYNRKRRAEKPEAVREEQLRYWLRRAQREAEDGIYSEVIENEQATS